MKRLFSLLLVIVLLFSITACNDDSEDGNNVTPVCSHVWVAATCTEAKTCSKCNETQGSALGHTTDSGICSRCGENFSAWEIGEYNDEFDMPSGVKYIITDSYGTFSNSATSNSTLYAAVQIDQEDIGIMLWEYGSMLVKGVYDYESYSITILDENGTKHYFTGTIYQGGTRVYFKYNDRASVISLLQNNDSLKIYLKTSKYSVSTYLFEIETKGFYFAYNQII